ncbi:MAG: hypothetical protein LBM02_06720 [Lachnospiraceae bacterium]|jgi:hypothetical protein|nr:hypothetical protein [Lachnospiraceae bacterium]
MKRRNLLLEAGILILVFILALIFFEFAMNNGKSSTTADMKEASYPLVSFETYGYQINLLYGYADIKNGKEIADTVTPTTDGKLSIRLDEYTLKIKSLEYELDSLDEKETLDNGKASVSGDVYKVSLDKTAIGVGEKLLKISLKTNKDTIYYYTKVVLANANQLKACVEYLGNFHQNAMDKVENTGVGKALEPDETGDNTDFSHTNIHATYDQVTYGDLNPVGIGKEEFQITSWGSEIVHSKFVYYFRAKGNINVTDRYLASEDYKIRYAPGGNVYLLDYDRYINQVLNPNEKVITNKGINLGITNDDPKYIVNKDNNIVAFIQTGDLFEYNQKEGTVSRVFSFSNIENTSIRNIIDMHKINIVNMENNGNISFTVSGYMSRGDHEGKCGVSVYYYYAKKNYIEEKAFFESKLSYKKTIDKYSNLMYFNKDKNEVYFFDGKTFYRKSKDNPDEVVKDNLSFDKFVASETGRYVAYPIDEHMLDIRITDLKTGKSKEVKGNADTKRYQKMRLLGFMGDDLICGIVFTDDNSEKVDNKYMNMLSIISPSGKYYKDYETDKNVLISNVVFKDKMLVINRVKESKLKYTKISDDYITQNEDNSYSKVSLETYTSDLKETEKRLVFAGGIDNEKANYLNPSIGISQKVETGEFKED